MKNKTLITDFTSGNIPKQLITFATPLFLSSLLQILYSMVDMIVVGHALGKTGISAVSVGGDIANFLTFIAMGFSNAGSVIISKYIGANKRGLIGRFILNMFMLLFGIAVVFGAGCLIFIDGLSGMALGLFSTSSSSLRPSG